MRLTETIANLKRLKADVKKQPVEKFDMGVFGERTRAPKGKATACGTTCCALGTAALDPYFQAKGLDHTWKKTVGEDKFYYMSIFKAGGTNDNRVDTAIQAGADVIGITYSEAYSIFMQTTHTKKKVLSSIQDLIEQYQALYKDKRSELESEFKSQVAQL